MRNLKYLIVVLVALALGVAFKYAFAAVPSKTFQVQSANISNKTISPSPTPSWTIFDKLKEKNDVLGNTALKVGNQDIEYVEYRGGIIKSKRTFKAPEREIALKILDDVTGEVTVQKIIQRGSALITTGKDKISIVERSNGIRWNVWNTAFHVDGRKTVIGMKFPEVNGYQTIKKQLLNSAGKPYTAYVKEPIVTNITYVPYSPDLHERYGKQLSEAGKKYTSTVVNEALNYLRIKKVKSRAFPTKYVSDVTQLSPTFFARLPLLEHTDLTEFVSNSKGSVDRALILIGSNPSVAFAKTGSSAGALGWVQYTNRTYQGIRQAYPLAQISPNFEFGAGDHLNSMVAAILLYDYNLDYLMKKYGKKISSDPKLEEYLASLYNASPTSVSKSLTASLTNGLDWISGLLAETKGYMTKLRYLQKNS